MKRWLILFVVLLSMNIANSSEIVKIGSLNFGIIDYQDGGSKNLYSLYIEEGEVEYDLKFLDENFPSMLDLDQGDRIQVTGSFDGSTILVEDIIILDKVDNGRASTGVNIENTIVLLTNFNDDDENRPFTREDVDSFVFDPNNPESLYNYYQELSYGQTSIVGTTADWVVMNIGLSQCDSLSSIAYSAIVAADPQVNFGGYNRLVIFYPYDSSCAPGGARYMSFGTDEGGLFNIPVSWIRVEFDDLYDDYTKYVVRHEVGHVIARRENGIGTWTRHSSALECGLEVVGDDCFLAGYQDIYDIMGRRDKWGHMSAKHKEKAGWIPSNQIIDVSVNGFGIYQIANIEDLDLESPMVLKFPRKNSLGDVEDSYYLEYRRNIGFDSLLPNLDGVMLRTNKDVVAVDVVTGVQNVVSTSYLLDMSPNVHGFTLPELDFDFSDAVLHVGEEYYDANSEFYVRVISINEDYVEVFIGDSIQACNTGADQEPCDGVVDIDEINDYGESWYHGLIETSDFLDGIEAYFGA